MAMLSLQSSFPEKSFVREKSLEHFVAFRGLEFGFVSQSSACPKKTEDLTHDLETAVFGLSKKDDLRSLNQRMGRFLNSIRYTDLETEQQRAESRIRLAEPCIAFLFCEANAPRSYAVGVTRDVALHGMSMFVEGELDQGDYVLILGSGDDRVMLKATCKRCIPDRFGMYAAGFAFSKVLSESSYPAIVQALTFLESPKVKTGEPKIANSECHGASLS